MVQFYQALISLFIKAFMSSCETSPPLFNFVLNCANSLDTSHAFGNLNVLHSSAVPKNRKIRNLI